MVTFLEFIFFLVLSRIQSIFAILEAHWINQVVVLCSCLCAFCLFSPLELIGLGSYLNEYEFSLESSFYFSLILRHFIDEQPKDKYPKG